MWKRKISVCFLHTSDSMIWIPCHRIGKFSCFSHCSPFERGIISKGSLFGCTFWNKLWNRLHWHVFWKNYKYLSRTITTAKMELFVGLVSSFQPLTNFTKNPSISAMGILIAPKGTLKFWQVIKLSIADL